MLLLVFDGLRPGSINPRDTPNLAALAQRGVTYTRSRTGFPSETMVGASELMAGAYPEVSGITGNHVAAPGSHVTEGVKLKSLEGLRQAARAWGGRIFGPRATTLYQALAGAGLTSAVVGKAGPAELAHLGGATWAASHDAVLPSGPGRRLDRRAGREPLAATVERAAGPPPGQGDPDGARSRWIARAAMAIDRTRRPDLMHVWFTDPDKTQHMKGLDGGVSRAALLQADAAAGMLLRDLRRRGELARMDVAVVSDHGFSAHENDRPVPLLGVLRRAGLDVEHVIASGNQHGVRFRRPPTPRDLERLREAIAASPIADEVRTVIDNAPRDPAARGDRRGDGRLTGRDLRVGAGPRAPHAVVIYDRDTAKGSHTAADPGPTIAGHGSLGWTDLNNTLVLAGPRIERGPGRGPGGGLRTPNAAGIFDVAPTVLHLLGVEPPAAMQGRVLHEALAGHGADGVVERVASRISRAVRDVVLGSRVVRTVLATEHVGGHSYHQALEATDLPRRRGGDGVRRGSQPRPAAAAPPRP